MINKHATDYTGPDPKSINSNYPIHTYETVICLINGECKSIIQERYLKKFGYTKQSYLEEFPEAPLKSWSAVDSYRNAALNDGGRRSRNLTQLNLYSSDFQSKRKKSCEEFYKSEQSEPFRQAARNRAKEQHQNGQAMYVKEYFNTRYIGSADQMSRIRRGKTKNFGNLPGARKKANATWLKNHAEKKHRSFQKNQYKTSTLYYQSKLEYHFLEFMESAGLLNMIKCAPVLKDALYPRKWYLPDYLLLDKYIVEIKSWYIEEKQLKINPMVTEEKQMLVNRSGYQWLYIKDADYTTLSTIINTHS